MQTVNISLPSKLAKEVDKAVEGEGYASRSEFIRALIRFYTANNERLELKPFKKMSLGQIEKELFSSGKYNQKFIKSVIKGLAKSSAYADN